MAMTDAQFREFWEALGNAVRAAMQPDPAVAAEASPAQAPQPAADGQIETPARDPASTTTTTAERAPAVWHRPPAPARAFGFGMATLDDGRDIVLAPPVKR